MTINEAYLAYNCYVRAKSQYTKLQKDHSDSFAKSQSFVPLDDLSRNTKQDVFALLQNIQQYGIGLHIGDCGKDRVQAAYFDSLDMDLKEYKEFVMGKIVII